ncbi:MAG: hypothetical protein V6Z89_19450 [Desulfobacter sp.]
MVKSLNINAKACCAVEKERLVEELRACDYGSTNLEARHLCYRRVAKESGRRAKQCLISG